MDKKKVVRIQLLVFIVLFFVIIGYSIYRENDSVFSILAAQSKNAIYSNYETGLYSENLTVHLSKDGLLPIKAKIFYTTDGEDPDKYSKEYTGEILIECEETEKIIPLKTVVYYKGKYSKVQEFTYIVCDNVSKRYNMPIISITTNRENLYDFDKGLFVPGSTYENSVREFDEEEYEANHLYQTVISGNYRERDSELWIRDAEMVLFDTDGSVTNESEIGLAISGGTSSAQYPKSLKLLGDYQDSLGQLELSFLDNRENAQFSIVDNYKSIRLRSGNQSGIGGNIRSTLISELANEANYDGCFKSKIVLVYLNGSFYGLMDMEQNYSNSFLKNKYNLEETQKAVALKGSEENCFKVAGIDTLFEKNLNIEENQIRLEEKLDVENYLYYCAINFYVNNTDWPHNNYEMWCYTGEYDINNKYTDGRYRFLMYDLDMAYKPESAGEWGEDLLLRLLDENGKNGSTGFLKLMKVKKYRDMFLTIMANLKKSAFNVENISKQIDIINNYMKKESDIQFHGTGWINDLNRESESIKSVSKNVISRLDKDLEKEFHLDGKYKFVLKNSNGVTSKILNEVIYENEVYNNEYFKDSQFELVINVNPGYKMNNIIVNGSKVNLIQSSVDKNEYLLTIDSKLIHNNEVLVNVSASRNQGANIIISEISAKDYNDWIKITNNGIEDINLENYYLSNDENNLLKYNLPSITLSIGESFIIDGKKNHFAVGDYICNFSISKYNTIFLVENNKRESTKVIFDRVYVPKMQINESYGRVKNSNIWNFYKNSSKRRV